ncbi:MAG: nicotinate phosphoribosyltransferase [Thermodesulfobacteriota bacterium]|nr:nicotinate phosphoribosyltransferase [Thermodesulfobacteriota bacterium]
MFHIATPEEILKGKITDIYFVRTLEVLRAKNKNPAVVAEICAKGFPLNWEWGVFAGLEEVIELLKDLPVKVKAFPEGTLFKAGEPLFIIEGNYNDFALFETAVLGFLCQASGIATQAARCRKLAGDKPILNFGARRMHPAISPMIDRSSFIGGCDGVSVIKSAEFLDEPPQGTMPHSLILIFGDTLKAVKAFNEVISSQIKRVALIDTFQDEKFESIRVAKALGKELFAVRLDTPSSRRGNFLDILREVRWELDIRGFKDVKLFVSGGIDEKAIISLNGYADAYGIGTFISNAPVIDFSFDIVEINGRAISKKGKHSGRKEILICTNCRLRKVIFASDPLPECSCGGNFERPLTLILENKETVVNIPSPQELRKKVLNQLSFVEISL